MRTAFRTLALAAMLVLAGAAAAWADTCFGDSQGNVLVGKGLVLPSANNCKAFNGFYNFTFFPVSGNVCKSFNNQFYLFNLTTGSVNNSFFDTFFIATGTNTGSGNFLFPDFGSGGAANGFNISKILCPFRQFGS